MSEDPISGRQRLSVLLAIVIALIAQAMVLSRMWPMVSVGRVDFRSLYQAGELVLHHSAPSYRLPAASGSSAADPPRYRDPQGPDNLHPPFELLIFAPLAALPYHLAYVVWYGCNLLMLVGVLLLLWKSAPGLRRHSGLVLLGATTAFPVLVSLSQGQDSILLLFLLTLSFLALKEGHDVGAGVALGLATFKFLLVGPLILGLLVARRWRAFAAYAATCVSLLLASFALIGAKAAISYWFFIFRFGRITPPAAKMNHMPTLREFVHTLIPGSVPVVWVDLVVIALSVLILGLVLARCAKARRADVLDLTFSMLVTTTAVISYHFFLHNATILLLPVLLAASHFTGPGRHTRCRMPFQFAVASMYFAPFVIPKPVDMLVFFCGSSVLLLLLYRTAVPNSAQDFRPMPVANANVLEPHF